MPTAITEITRRDIIDRLVLRGDGWYCGRLELTDFLARVFDLEAMPSTDGRFPTAAGDIWQHMVRNNDWDDHYLLGRYLNLLGVSDDTFLKFLCEVLHPVVRQNADEAGEVAEMCNDLLRHDGYRLVPKDTISGRPVFGAVVVDPLGEPAASPVLNYGLFAVELARRAKDAYTHSVLAMMAKAVFPFEYQEHPSNAFGETKAGLIYNWVMTLAGQVISEERKLHMLSEFTEALVGKGDDLSAQVRSARAGISPKPTRTDEEATTADDADFAPSYEYDVAISFAGEERLYAGRLASALEALGIGVFYDKDQEVTLWGKDLERELRQIYEEKARYCVMLISKSYKEKAWPSRERGAAIARSLCQRREYILPVRIDKTEIEGLTDQLSWLPATYTPTELARRVAQKVRSSSDNK